MKKLSILAGLSLFMLLAATQAAEARTRFVFSFGIGVPVYAPYGYYAPYPGYCYYPPYPAYCAPYYYHPGPVVRYYSGYYGPRLHRAIPRHGYVRGHVPPGHAYGRYAARRYVRR